MNNQEAKRRTFLCGLKSIMRRGKTYDAHTPTISLRGLHKGPLLRAPQVRKLAGLVFWRMAGHQVRSPGNESKGKTFLAKNGGYI